MAKQAGVADPSVQSPEALVREVGTDPETGLTSTQASRRLQKDGLNQLRATRPVPGWKRLLMQFQDPLVYLLLFAIVISVLAWAIEGWSGWPIDGLVIILIVVGNAVLGYVQAHKAENAVAALAKMTEVTSAVLRDGVVSRIPSTGLVVGDILISDIKRRM